MQLRKASRKQAKIKLALQGTAGSGKTMSALLLAGKNDEEDHPITISIDHL